MMNLTTLAQGENEQTMSSIQLVEIINEYRKLEGNNTNLLHRHFIQKIEKELDGGETIFRSTYLDKSNRQTKCYNLPKDECMLMLMSESRTVRKGVLERLKELELKVNRPSYQIENPIERAKAWIVEYEEKVLLIEANTKLQFRSDFVDICFDADGVFSMEEVAKLLKLPYGRNTMLKELREKKLFLNSNTPKQSLIKAGYFKVVESLIENGRFKKVISATYATQKGLGYIHKMLDNKKALN